jgi:hypothetical protein
LDEERIEGQETGEAQEGAQEAEVQESGAESGTEPEITLDESGDLNIPDSFWDDEGTPEDKKPEEPEEPKPGYYTPEDFAKAYQSGQIDESKIDPAVADYYKRVAAVERQRQEAEALRRQAVERAPKPQPRPQITIDQVMEGAKRMASQWLGIKPEEFDEFDERHKAMRLMAVNEIREQAQAAARQETEERRAWEARVAGVSNVIAEYRQKTPEINEIANRFFPAWRENLTVRQHEAVNYILRQGNEAQVRQLLDKVIADYRALKNPPRKAAPPGVMSARGSENEDSPQGVVDVSNLGGMSPEDQADFLIRNKFIA